MQLSPHSPCLPGCLLALVALYFVASLAHFSHNAEYIAFYPGMPQWLTRETVYLAWLGVSSVGLLAAVLFKLGFNASALLVLGAYGALGLDGLAHYTLALCAEHTLAANITIWSEAGVGLLVLLLSVVLFSRRIMRRSVHRGG